MAKRSDFAQKLLDDLRVRKEKMTAPQSSNRSNSMAIDAYAYSNQTFRGRGDTRTNGTMGSKMGNAYNRSSGGSRTPMIQEASNQMVAYGSGRGRSTQQMGDLSMALAFALENGAKLGRTDTSSRNSMLGFFNQIGRGAMNFSKMGRKGSMNSNWGSTNQFPNLSHVHIEEISRGAQKLNQILRACSNGLNVDRFSIEIGKELMKGAMDLEESLRMLVNLQEASEYMVSSQRKNRITLLDEDEDDEDDTVKIAEQKQLDLPRFSFDKSSRYARKTQEVGRSGLKQKLTAALTYSREGSSFNHEKQGKISSSVSQRQPVSYSPAVKNQSISSEQKESKPEKERIPNVIAKLMGLNELPKNENLKHTTQKDYSSKTKKEGWEIGQTIRESSKSDGVKNKDFQNPLMPNTALVLHAEKNMFANNVSLEVIIQDGMPPWKDVDGLKNMKGPGKTTIKTDNQQRNLQTMKPDKPVVDNSFEGELTMQGKAGSKEIRLQMEKKNGNKILPSNPHKSQNNHELQKPSMHWKSESPEEKRRGEVKEQQSAQQKLQARKQRGSEVVPKSISKGAVLKKKQPLTDQARVNKKTKREVEAALQSKGVPNGTYRENMVRSKSSVDLQHDTKDASPNCLDPETAKQKFGIPPVMEERPVHVPPFQREKSRRVNKSEMPRRIDEVATRRNGTLNNLTRPLKNQSSMQEVAHRRHEKLSVHDVAEKVRASRPKQAKLQIVKSNKPSASIHSLKLGQNLQKEADHQASTLYDPNEVECRSLKEPQTLLPKENCQNSVLVVTNDQQDQARVFADDECINASNTLNGFHEDSLDISYAEPLVEHRKTFNWRKQEPLTESENHLKQIVIKSQLFLNTAEALFKLDIPFGILHDSGHDCTQDEDVKLTLDCGYEVMKRKGRRQELSVHPNCVKISISFTKIESLDELVKQLHKDLEKLKRYGKNGKMECDAEEYLPRMLESDMHNLEPDMNCMWDIGWDDTMFAILEVDDVVKDLEKLLLSGLVDELTRDLFHTR